MPDLPIQLTISYNYDNERRTMIVVTNLRQAQLDQLLAMWLCKTHSLTVQAFCKYVELQDAGYMCKPAVNLIHTAN